MSIGTNSGHELVTEATLLLEGTPPVARIKVIVLAHPNGHHHTVLDIHGANGEPVRQYAISWMEQTDFDIKTELSQ